MSETLPTHTAEQDRKSVDHEHVRTALGAMSVDHAINLIKGFHGSDEHYFGRPLDQQDKIHSIVVKSENGKQSNEVIGQGESVESALYDTFLAMRSLETVKTKPLTRLEISEGVDVDFTNLEHYALKVAPTIEAYGVPDHVKPLLESNRLGRHTYDNTVAEENWDKQIFDQINRFTQSQRGAELVRSLKISDLRALTPEQAVKLSLSMVHDLSKYSFGDDDKPDGNRADTMTTMQLLEEGFARKDDPNWSGNGVCRNIASDVKAVFESLKINQHQVNMLHNTYASYAGGYEDFRINKRENAGDSVNLKDREPGHAWNTFTTIDTKGDASVTVADVTWSLEKTPEAALENMDHTMTRSARTVRKLFEQSDNKEESFHSLNEYYKNFLRDGFQRHRQSTEFDVMTQFIMKEYLQAAQAALKEASPTWIQQEMPHAPDYVQGAAYRLGDNLAKSELTTLFRLSEEAYAIDNFDGILQSYVRGGKNKVIGTSGGIRAEQLAFTDEALSAKVIGLLDPDKIREYADSSTAFRVQARKFAPNALPSFDITNFNDQREIVEVAKQNGLNVLSGDPRTITSAIKRGLLRAANGNEDKIQQLMARQDLYTLVGSYRETVKSLSNR